MRQVPKLLKLVVTLQLLVLLTFKSDTLSVKGDNKFITTAASGNDITLTVNEQAIKTAAKDAGKLQSKS